MTDVSEVFSQYINQPKLPTKIWRYMDFTKYVSLLDRHSLFFCQLKQFDDKYEGAWSLLVQDEYLQSAAPNDPELVSVRYLYDVRRARTAASCWHMSNDESAALWKLYLSSNEGIAIQTTVDKLLRSLSHAPGYTGQVNYHPPGWRSVGKATSDITPFIKRASFEHEHEYRVAYLSDQLEELGGMYVSVLLETLIETVYIAPTAQPWFKQLVEDITVRTYGLSVPFVRSDLDSAPLY